MKVKEVESIASKGEIIVPETLSNATAEDWARWGLRALFEEDNGLFIIPENEKTSPHIVNSTIATLMEAGNSFVLWGYEATDTHDLLVSLLKGYVNADMTAVFTHEDSLLRPKLSEFVNRLEVFDMDRLAKTDFNEVRHKTNSLSTVVIDGEYLTAGSIEVLQFLKKVGYVVIIIGSTMSDEVMKGFGDHFFVGLGKNATDYHTNMEDNV